jgi:prolyl-tRNA editing enzyme YbaK/EbsC (Cys-tRNA(Pro) deacylase)
MNQYEEKLKRYINDNNIKCEYLCFDKSCHTVEDSAKTANTSRENIVKNICLIDSNARIIVAILKGNDRVSLSRIARALNIPTPRFATNEEVILKTGYPVGGVPSFGFDAVFLIDQKVMEKKMIYTGAGSENCLVKISPYELQKANKGLLAIVTSL